MSWQAAGAASFFTCWLAILALRPLAVAVNLVDRPGGRKTHHGEIPVVGGLAMFIGIVLGVGLLAVPDVSAAAFLAACAILVTFGLIDDRFELSPWTRLPGQVAAALVLILGSGTTVTTLGDPFGTGVIHFSGLSSIAFTTFIVVAAINAFNMLDGMDGLAGTAALTSLVAIALLAESHSLALAISMVMIGAVCAFLLFNLPLRSNSKVHCFMGDAGSTLLGFAVAWLCIQISQGPAPAVTPVMTFWFVALPLYELIWSTARRIIRGVSPFKADTSHFHHLLLKAGFDVRAAFALFATLTFALAGIGLVCRHYQLADRYSLLLLTTIGIVTIRLTYSARLLRVLLPRSVQRIGPADGLLDRSSHSAHATRDGR